jgi:hypothetical protein
MKHKHYGEGKNTMNTKNDAKTQMYRDIIKSLDEKIRFHLDQAGDLLELAGFPDQFVANALSGYVMAKAMQDAALCGAKWEDVEKFCKMAFDTARRENNDEG